ncbi:hypothetical protein Q7P37_001512 [Cladosporium fusiforme]
MNRRREDRKSSRQHDAKTAIKKFRSLFKSQPDPAADHLSSGRDENEQVGPKSPVTNDEVPEPLAPSRSERGGHRYQHVSAEGNSRLHLGDTYIEQQNILSDEDEKTRARRQEERFLENLGFSLMESRLATISAADFQTCRWLYTNEAYLRWRNPRSRASHHGFLWIKGKPGAGKSTLMKHALQNAQRHNREHNTILSHFFNARGHDLEKTTEGMYRSLLHQVFSAFPARIPRPIPKYAAHWKDQGWPLPILQDWLRQAILGFGNRERFVCYIDALDECHEDDIRLAIENLESIGDIAKSQGIQLSVCFASRHYPTITMEHSGRINLDVETAHQRDIAKFVSKNLRGERALRHELAEDISSRSSGVFLWAALVIRIVNAKADRGATRSQLLNELQRVPTGIEELLGSIMQDQGHVILPTLLWVLFSQRPLSVSELYVAINFSADHPEAITLDHTEATVPQMRKFILTMSRGMVEFTRYSSNDDENGNSSVQFIHETVKGYLLGGGLATLDTSLSGNVVVASHARLGQWCQNYLATLGPTDDLRSPFIRYACYFMLKHMKMAHGAIDLQTIDSIPQSVWTRMRIFRDEDSDTNTAPTALYILIRYGYEDLAIAMIMRQSRVARSDTARKTAPPMVGDPGVGFVNVNQLCGSTEHATALLATALMPSGQSSRRIVKALLGRGADPNLTVKPRHTSLAAALNRYTVNFSECELLLCHGADPNAEVQTRIGRLPLAAAVQLGDPYMIDLFLRFGANINGKPEARPLCLAAAHSPPSIVRQLLVAGADANKRDQSGAAVLYMVATRFRYLFCDRQQRVIIAQALLNAGADVNAVDNNGRLPLVAAVQFGIANMIDLFLRSGALVDGHPEARPLHIAAGYASPSIVRQLLAAGADANKRDQSGATALHEVANRWYTLHDRQRCAKIAKSLPDAGADVNAVDNDGNTALSLVASYKRDDNDGSTVFGLVSSYEGNVLPKLFIERGADLDVSRQKAIALGPHDTGDDDAAGDSASEFSSEGTLTIYMG